MLKIFDEDLKAIKIPDPHFKTDYYLKRVGASSVDDLTTEQLQKIFLFAINDFKLGEVSLDGLSSIASYVWPTPKELDADDVEELKDVIHDCSEINFYVRKIPEVDKDGSATLAYLMRTLLYFDKHKGVIGL